MLRVLPWYDVQCWSSYMSCCTTFPDPHDPSRSLAYPAGPNSSWPNDCNADVISTIQDIQTDTHDIVI